MNDSTARNLALNIPHASAGAARPKILRRPPQLSALATAIPLNIPPAMLTETPLATEVKPPTLSRPWQDDGKFAVTLLGIVIAINLIVIVWLSAIAPKPVAPQPTMKPAHEEVINPTIHELGAGDTGAEQ